ncbi:MAG: aspartate/glutamate racemase family protein [Zestosphaera sp.]
MIKILVVVPVGTDVRNRSRKAVCERYASPGTVIEVVSLTRGPLSLETRRDHDEAVPLIIETVERVGAVNYDAVVISCFLDPAVGELRKMIKDKVVIGSGEASLYLARFLGEPITVITVGAIRETLEMMEEHVEKLGLRDVVDVRGIPYGVLDADRDKNTALKLLAEESMRAKENGSRVVVVGCTAMAGFAEELEEVVGIPVVDPLKASIILAEALVRLYGGSCGTT